MTDEAQRARDAAMNFEGRLMGFKKTRDSKGTWVEVRYQIHPQDVPHALQLADLGTRYQIAAVEIGDDEQPVVPQDQPKKSGRKWGNYPPVTGASSNLGVSNKKPKRQWDDIPPSEQAGIACGDSDFIAWAAGVAWHQGQKEGGAPWTTEDAAKWVRHTCNVKSRTEFDGETEPAIRWHDLYARFQRETGRVAEETR